MTAASMPTMSDFWARVQATNPFTVNRVSALAHDLVDVDAIHLKASERLVALATEACAERRGLGVVLWGEAGIGKSHVLARLARWASIDRHACLVSVHNLQANPDNLPRALLHCILSVLTRGRTEGFAETYLFRLVNSALRTALGDPDGAYSWKQVERAYQELVDRLCDTRAGQAAIVDRAVYDVLFRFYYAARQARDSGLDEHPARSAVRWLAGDYLDAGDARLLGLTPGQEAVALADNQQIKQVLVALTQLAQCRGQPFVLCFDQVDNLDTEQAAALSRFLEALLDSSPNLLVVTAGVQATLLSWRQVKVIQDSAWDRLTQFEIALQRISPAQGADLILARQRQFLEAYRELDEVQVRLRQDAFFPLGSRWCEQFLRDKIELRPRDVFSAAREAWYRLRDSSRVSTTSDGEPSEVLSVVPLTPAEQLNAVDEHVAQRLSESRSHLVTDPLRLPGSAEHMIGLIKALLQQCQQLNLANWQVEIPLARGKNRPHYDLMVRPRSDVEAESLHVGLAFLSTGSAMATTTRLRGMLQDRNIPEHVWIITEERSPLALGNKGEEYLAKLSRNRKCEFRVIELPFAAYADLDSLQAVVLQARAGDLELPAVGGKPLALSEREVMESFARQSRYQSAAILRDLLALQRVKASRVPAQG